jgi:hypothetical protein
VFAGLRRRLRGFTGSLLGSIFGSSATDGCNKFTNIADCVDPTKTSPDQCGFCIGAFVQYKDPTMPKDAHCAGFGSGGQPADAICPTPGIWCQGALCAKGWNCVGGAGSPTAKCSNTTQPPFNYRTKDECEKGAGSLPACKAAQMVKCNETTKKCDINCDSGTPGCNTKDFCEATCALPHAKCNHTTKQCTPCDKGKDPTCTMTANQCSTECSKNYQKCDHMSGKCGPCTPTGPTDPSCTVGGCSDPKCKQNMTKFSCDRSNPQIPHCVENKTSTKTMEECAKTCKYTPPSTRTALAN